MNKEFIGVMAGAISLIAYAPYMYSIIRHRTKPSRSSWWIWSFVGFIILINYYNVGARNTIWIPLVFLICPLVIAILSLKYGLSKGFSRLDKICLIVAGASLVIWFITHNPLITLSINIFIDFIGFLPTFQKTYAHPRSENRFAWTLFFLGSILNVIALESYQFAIALYPAYMFIMDIIMIYIFFIKKSFNFQKI